MVFVMALMSSTIIAAAVVTASSSSDSLFASVPFGNATHPAKQKSRNLVEDSDDQPNTQLKMAALSPNEFRPSASSQPSPSPNLDLNGSSRPSMTTTARPSLHPSRSLSPSLNTNAKDNLSSRVPSNAPSWWERELPLPSYRPSSSYLPSMRPSILPSHSLSPTIAPTVAQQVSSNIFSRPESGPTQSPWPSGTFWSTTYEPTQTPEPSSEVPSTVPSRSPSILPSVNPTVTTVGPSYTPSTAPNKTPSVSPSNGPSFIISDKPSIRPSIGPSIKPSEVPSPSPSVSLSNTPSTSPSFVPSALPSSRPSSTEMPSANPSYRESAVPSEQPTENSASPSAVFLDPLRKFTTPTLVSVPTTSPYPSNTLMSSIFEPTESLSHTNTPSSTIFPSITLSPQPTVRLASSPPTAVTMIESNDNTASPTINPRRDATPFPSSKSPNHSPTSAQDTDEPTPRPNIMSSNQIFETNKSASLAGADIIEEMDVYDQCAEFLRNTYQLSNNEGEARDSIRKYCSNMFRGSFSDSPSSSPVSQESSTPSIAPMESHPPSLLMYEPPSVVPTNSAPEEQTLAPSSTDPTKSNEPSSIPINDETVAEDKGQGEDFTVRLRSNATDSMPTVSPTSSPATGTGKLGLVRVYNTWEMSNTAGLAGSVLRSSSHFELLLKAYTKFIERTVDKLQGQGPPVPENRRRLVASFESERASIYKIIDIACPDSASPESRCQRAFGQADIATDDSPMAFYNAYINASQLAISRGDLQKELIVLHPESIISVIETRAIVSPESSSQTTNESREQLTVDIQTESDDNAWTIVLINAVVAICIFLPLLLLGFYINRRRGTAALTEKEEYDSDDSSVGSNGLKDGRSTVSEFGVCDALSLEPSSFAIESECRVEDDGGAVESSQNKLHGNKEGKLTKEDCTSLKEGREILSHDSTMSYTAETFSTVLLDDDVMESLGLKTFFNGSSNLNETLSSDIKPASSSDIEANTKTLKPKVPVSPTLSKSGVNLRSNSNMQMLMVELQGKLAARQSNMARDDLKWRDVESPRSQTFRDDKTEKSLRWATDSLAFSESDSDDEDIPPSSLLDDIMGNRTTRAILQTHLNSDLIQKPGRLENVSSAVNRDPQQQEYPRHNQKHESDGTFLRNTRRSTWLHKGAAWIRTIISMQSTDDWSYETKYDSDTDDSEEGQPVRWVLQNGEWVRQILDASSWEATAYDPWYKLNTPPEQEPFT